MAGFPRVLLSVHRAWQERQEEISGSADEMTEHLRTLGSIARALGRSTSSCSTRPGGTLMRNFEPIHGGFGRARSFPTPWIFGCCCVIT